MWCNLSGSPHDFCEYEGKALLRQHAHAEKLKVGKTFNYKFKRLNFWCGISNIAAGQQNGLLDGWLHEARKIKLHNRKMAPVTFRPHNQVKLTLAAQAAAPESGFLRQDWHTGPQGSLAINSRYLVRDDQPWLPVMGEFHYSRFPRAQWATELRKMRAGGIQIVASYVFWNHHEALPGQFDWSDNKDLRHFVQLVGELGMLFSLRVGPWVHGEARYGGFPDWLINTVPATDLRTNAPAYLAHVERLYGAIGEQVTGLMWQDGGPVMAVQIENEYDRVGPSCGAEHIAELKRIAIASGLKVPLYTVTGWPTLDIPAREVVPLSGAYADGFWQGSSEPLPASGVFLFNTSRVIGEMGNVGGTPAAGQIDPQHYPFFLAEAGGGMHMSYHRRPVISTQDVYATALTQIGSGANLYGYYMYHGGTNPVGAAGYLNETQDTGYPNDVPLLGYDFHAPLGQYGQIRPSFGHLGMLHQFVAAYGAQLARLPATLADGAPADPSDATQLRVCARGDEQGGFVFINNHVRHHPLPDFAATQLQLQIGDTAVLVPEQPITIPSGTALIWPVLQRLGGALLRYATAQPLTRLSHETVPCYVYFSVEGIAPEFCFDAQTIRQIDCPQSWLQTRDGCVFLRPSLNGEPVVITLTDSLGAACRLIVLDQCQAAGSTVVELHDQQRLVISEQGCWQDGNTVHVYRDQTGPVSLAVFPGHDLQAVAADAFAVFQQQIAEPADIAVQVSLQRPATMPPLRYGPHISWRSGPVPLAPDDASYQHAAIWQLALPDSIATQSTTRWLLQLDYAGDAARLYADGVLTNDQFYDGTTWETALDDLFANGRKPQLTLHVLPTQSDAAIFLEPAARERLATAPQPEQPALLRVALCGVNEVVFEIEKLHHIAQ